MYWFNKFISSVLFARETTNNYGVIHTLTSMTIGPQCTAVNTFKYGLGIPDADTYQMTEPDCKTEIAQLYMDDDQPYHKKIASYTKYWNNGTRYIYRHGQLNHESPMSTTIKRIKPDSRLFMLFDDTMTIREVKYKHGGNVTIYYYTGDKIYLAYTKYISMLDYEIINGPFCIDTNGFIPTADNLLPSDPTSYYVTGTMFNYLIELTRPITYNPEKYIIDTDDTEISFTNKKLTNYHVLLWSVRCLESDCKKIDNIFRMVTMLIELCRPISANIRTTFIKHLNSTAQPANIKNNILHCMEQYCYN